MKLGIFTDSHYSSQKVTCGNRYNSKSLEKIKAAYEFFESQKCDLVVCLGDLIDKEASHEKEVENLKNVAKIINNSSLKTICLMGNHDAFAFTEAEFYEILGNCKPKNVNADDKALLFLDACYFKNGNHYLPGDTDWTDTFYPHIQDLKIQLEKATGDVYIFVHQNLDPTIREDHRVYNSAEINTLLLNSGKVKTVFQGHYHTGNKCIYNDISYLTFPALCENENAYFIEEI
ncbi:MAG: metallophosphoesterase [Clostridia bacterium]|nr:metallophosphoesterase [Clostridia bacterium]